MADPLLEKSSGDVGDAAGDAKTNERGSRGEEHDERRDVGGEVDGFGHAGRLEDIEACDAREQQEQKRAGARAVEAVIRADDE